MRANIGPAAFSFSLASVLLVLTSLPAFAAEPQRIDSDEQSFATAVQTDGDVTAVGVPDAEIDEEPARGRAHVYVREQAGWIEAVELLALDGAAGDRFGAEVAVDGDIVAVAAPFASVNGLLEAGAVYVYERDVDGSWRQVDRLAADDPTTMARFGSDIGLDGARMIVAAPRADEELGQGSGAAYIFDRDAASGSWQQTAKLKDDMTNEFAAAVDISGDTAALDANGLVSVFQFNGTAWNFMQTVQGSSFDIAVKLEDDVLVIADPDATVPDQAGLAVGQVNVFERADNTWTHVASLQSLSPVQLDRFGHSVDLNDGVIAVANGPQNPDHLSLFMKDGTGNWSRVQTVDADVLFPDIDQSLAVSAETLVTGGPNPFGGFINLFDLADVLADGVDAGDDDTGVRDIGIAGVDAEDDDDDTDTDADADIDSDLDVDTDLDTDSGADLDLDSDFDSDTDDAASDAGSGDGGTTAEIAFGEGRTIDDDDSGGGAMAWLIALLLSLLGRRRLRSA